MPLTNVPIKQMMNKPWPEIKTVDDMAKWCAIPKGELRNQIAWCFNRFADFTEYVYYNQYFTCPKAAKHILDNTETIPAMSC
jgi:hypothetical protein